MLLERDEPGRGIDHQPGLTGAPRQRIRLRMAENRDEIAAAVTGAARLRLPRGSD